MRKFRFLVITIILVLFICACDTPASNDDKSVVFYYVHNEIEYGTESGVITSTVAEVDIDSDNYDAILALYFNGPTNYECVSPFAAGTTMEEFGIDGNKAEIMLSPHMGTLNDSALTVALACLTRTIVELTGVSTVQVRIHNSKIFGEDAITLSLNSFNYFDDITPDDLQ